MRPEGLFVIDNQQRIVEWSDAASMAIGVSAAMAVGRPCYEVVHGRDMFGRPVCHQGCPPFGALQKGQVVADCTLHVKLDTAGSLALRCELMALPAGGRDGGGAIVRLLSRSPDPHSGVEERADTKHSGSVVRDLSALAALTTSLSPRTAHQSLERALDLLLQASGAEVGEVFLAERAEKGMVLTAHKGPFEPAFSQMTRFRAGEGYPGLVLARRESIETRSLGSDSRYLRTRVKARGFSAYVCVPILGPQRLIGSVHLASRRPDFDPEPASRLLSWASTPIGLMLQAVGSVPNETSLPWTSTEGAEDETDRLLRRILTHMTETVGARGGALLLLHSSGGVSHAVHEGAGIPATCPGLGPGASQPCPALQECRVLTLYEPQRSWPLPCRQSLQSGYTRYCVPVTDESGATSGLIQIAWQEQSLRPPTRHAWLLQEMTEHAAPAVRLARDFLERLRRTGSMFGASLSRGQALGEPKNASEAARSETRTDERSLNAADEPYLDIRCLGSFELRRRGVLVSYHEVHRQKVVSLLKILLTYEGRPQSKETLMDLLWPEVDPQVGASRLWVVVHALRQLVEPADSWGDWVYIKNEGDRYFLAPDAPCRVDVRDFKAFLRLGQEAEGRGDARDAIAAYEAAASLYTGDFLEDEPFAEWCWTEREQLRENNLSVRKAVAALCLRTGDVDRSIHHLRAAIWADPIREEAHRELMRCLWVAGRRDEALRQYEICRDLLQRELEVGPLPETEALAQTIRSS